MSLELNETGSQEFRIFCMDTTHELLMLLNLVWKGLQGLLQGLQ